MALRRQQLQEFNPVIEDMTYICDNIPSNSSY
jgi:hypothetical protein